MNIYLNLFSISATGGWPEQENPHAARISSLIDFHKILASRERQNQERKKFDPKRTSLQFVLSLFKYLNNYD